jgi:hypothetical protein
MKKELADRIKLLSKAMNANDVQYLFIGGVAISFYPHTFVIRSSQA